MWAYVVSFDNSVSQREMLDALNTLPGVLNWYTCLPNAVFVVSSWSATVLAEQIREETGAQRLIVLDADTDRNGWLPRRAWEFLRNPRPAQR